MSKLLLVALWAFVGLCRVHSQSKVELEIVQDVNMYLLNAKLALRLEPPLRQQQDKQLTPPTANQLAQKDAIEQALEELRLKLKQLQKDDLLEWSQLDEKYRILLGASTDLRSLLAFLQKLNELQCDQESIDFLVILANFRRHARGAQEDSSLLLQNYARLRIQICWHEFLSTAVRQIDLGLGKMKTPIYRFLERLGQQIQRQRLGEIAQRSHLTGSIKIDDSRAQEEMQVADFDSPNSMQLDAKDPLIDMVVSLKEVRLATEMQRMEFARALKKLFEAHQKSAGTKSHPSATNRKQFVANYLEAPCEEVVNRVRDIVSGAENFLPHVGQTLGQTLALMKQQDVRLDYTLQVYRICKLANQHRASIQRSLWWTH